LIKLFTSGYKSFIRNRHTPKGVTMIDDTTAEMPSDILHRKMDAELAKLLAEISKISAETSRINRETSTYPWLPLLTTAMGSTGLIGAIAALIIAFHH